MASGTNKYKYQSDKGNIFYARTDDSDELSGVRGEQPTGAVTENITFKVSRGSKEVGCTPRHVILYLKTSTTSDGCLVNPKTVSKKVVVLKNSTTLTPGTEVPCNGRTWIIGSVVGEQMR